MNFEIVRQHDISDCGAACLSMICRHYGAKRPFSFFRSLIKVDNNGASIYGVVKGAEQIGLEATALEGTPDELLDEIKKHGFDFPIIARVIIDGILEHFVVVYEVSSQHFYVADPAKGRDKYTYEEFFKLWTGHIIAFKKTSSFVTGNFCKGSSLRFIRPVFLQKKLLALILIISLAITSISFTGALIFKFIVEAVEHNSAQSIFGFSLSQICFAIIGLYIFQSVIEIVRGYLLSSFAKKISIPITLELYNHIIDLPMSQLDTRKTGELMSRFSNAQEIADTITGTILSLAVDTFMVLVCVWFLISINFNLFFITLAVVLAYAAVTVAFISPIKGINEKQMEQNAEVTSFLKEHIDGISTIKAFGVESIGKNKFSSLIHSFLNTVMKSSVTYVAQNSLSGLIASCGVIVLLWSGTYFVLDGIISLSSLLAFYALFGYFLSPIQRLVGIQPELQAAFVAAMRVNDILDLPTESNTVTERIGGNYDIKMRDVNFRYGNRHLVLKNINLNIKFGECVAFVGESGSGKTTLAKLIMDFYTPESGSVSIGSKNLAHCSSKQVRENVAYVSQDIFLFSGSVRNNLTLGNIFITDEEIIDVCKMCHAHEFIEKLPLGYNTRLGENGHDLSGGQKQRLAIARALLKKPSVLIMDEATSNLDSITEQGIRSVVNSLKGKMTCIIIAHRLNTIKDCERIYVMKDGTIVESGSHEELFSKESIYKSYLQITQ